MLPAQTGSLRELVTWDSHITKEVDKENEKEEDEEGGG